MKKIITLILFLAPGVIFASGFVPDSIWLSESSPKHDDVIEIFVTVYNGSDSNLSGDVLYYDSDLLLGEIPVVVSPRSAKLVSLSWRAEQGDRVIFAKLSLKDGVPEETKKIRLRVKKPIIPEIEGSVDEKISDSNIKDLANKFGEKAVSLAGDGFEKTEEGRDISKNFFQDKKDQVSEKKTELISGENENVDSSFEYNLKKVLLSLLLWSLTVLVFVTSYKIIFYAVILALLYLGFRLFKRRREAYD